ncbi:Riboflavin synthase [Thiorhodovibrio winogradskyi]|uniref:Riboflavin synthase n=1 Tax=Thiorhodovibrio winogradskyi TaxID=77007 RepID=A0ABZ0S6P3_9GAMM|nr:riboflavin synthase [Thiorhodovibrio winogradskyi]
MFTGIIQAAGHVAQIKRFGSDARLSIQCPEFDLQLAKIGDSIAVNGVCLTVVGFLPDGFSADVSRETLSLTTLAEIRPGTLVNLESALTLATPLGGHLVSGHVDGIGTVLDIREEARSLQLSIEVPNELTRYISCKGSIAVDGISLTVNDITGSLFYLNVVPHTRVVTNIQNYRSTTRVNIEVDLIARYLERLIIGKPSKSDEYASVSKELLARHGFL